MVATTSSGTSRSSVSTSKPSRGGGPPRPEIAPPIEIHEDAETENQTLSTFLALNSTYADICRPPGLSIGGRKGLQIIESKVEGEEEEEQIAEEQRELAETITDAAAASSKAREESQEIETVEEYFVDKEVIAEMQPEEKQEEEQKEEEDTTATEDEEMLLDEGIDMYRLLEGVLLVEREMNVMNIIYDEKTDILDDEEEAHEESQEIGTTEETKVDEEDGDKCTDYESVAEEDVVAETRPDEEEGKEEHEVKGKRTTAEEEYKETFLDKAVNVNGKQRRLLELEIEDDVLNACCMFG